MAVTNSIGILGTGRKGVKHVELIAQRPLGARLSGVENIVADSAKHLTRHLGSNSFFGPNKLMGLTGVDAIGIGTSTNTHVNLLVMALGDSKPTFCEKLVSLSLSMTDRTLMAVAESKD